MISGVRAGPKNQEKMILNAISGYRGAMMGSWRPSQAILALCCGHLAPSWSPLRRSVAFLEGKAFRGAAQGRLRALFWGAIPGPFSRSNGVQKQSTFSTSSRRRLRPKLTAFLDVLGTSCEGQLLFRHNPLTLLAYFLKVRCGLEEGWKVASGRPG